MISTHSHVLVNRSSLYQGNFNDNDNYYKTFLITFKHLQGDGGLKLLNASEMI